MDEHTDSDWHVNQEEDAGAAVFISHRGTQKERYALPLKTMLEESGVTTFVDERNLQPGEEADPKMEGQLRGATLVVFLLTPDFLGSSFCMTELQWALEQREKDDSKTPKILPVFLKEYADFGVGDLHKLNKASLEMLRTSKPSGIPGATWISDCSKHLHSLSRFTAIRSNSYPEM